MLEALGHPQPPTPIKTDNSTAQGFVYDNINQKKSKSWDMRFYWLRDREEQKQFKIYWDKGSNNNADYQTKHHPTSHHKAIRSRYVKDLIVNTGQSLNLMIQCLTKSPFGCEGVLLPQPRGQIHPHGRHVSHGTVQHYR